VNPTPNGVPFYNVWFWAEFRFPLPDISNNVGPVKLFLNTLLSFHLKEFFSFVLFVSFLFFSASTTTARS
jgi:hypothetical protein